MFRPRLRQNSQLRMYIILEQRICHVLVNEFAGPTGHGVFKIWASGWCWSNTGRSPGRFADHHTPSFVFKASGFSRCTHVRSPGHFADNLSPSFDGAGVTIVITLVTHEV